MGINKIDRLIGNIWIQDFWSSNEKIEKFMEIKNFSKIKYIKIRLNFFYTN